MMSPNLTYFMLNQNIECIYCQNSSVHYGLHTHTSHFTIGYILEGTLQITGLENTSDCQKDEFFLIKPDIAHSIQTPVDTVCTFISLCIDTAYLLSTELETILQVVKEYFISLKQDFSPDLFEDALTVLYADLTGLYTEANQMITDSNDTTCYISDLKTSMLSAPQLPLSIHEMATSICISPYYMIRKFKDEYGLTPHQFQIQSRIRQAQRLLEKNSVIEVAYATGFCDQSHFDRCFSKLVGLTPTDYKASIKHLKD